MTTNDYKLNLLVISTTGVVLHVVFLRRQMNTTPGPLYPAIGLAWKMLPPPILSVMKIRSRYDYAFLLP